MKPIELLRILWARKLLIALVVALVVGAVAAVNIMTPRTYVAVASVVVTSRPDNPITGRSVQPQTLAAQVATQMDVARSRNVALKVVDAARLMSNPHMHDARPAGMSDARWREQLAAELSQRLRVYPARDSGVFQIEFSHGDAAFAARLANQFAESYLRTSVELRLDPARRQTLWFDEQVQEMRGALEAARERLSDYQRTHGIVGTDERLDVERARLEEIARRLSEAQTAAATAQSRAAQMNAAMRRGDLDQVPDIMSASLLQNLKADLARAESKLAEVAERYGGNYPQHQSAAAEVRAISTRLTTEIDKVRGSIEQSARLAQEQERRIRATFEAQKARVLQLQRERDEASVLNREVESAQRAYDGAMARAGEVRMESELDMTNVAVLDQAVVPDRPARPRFVLNLALAFIVGGMLGAALAMTAELHNRRIRRSEDLYERAGLAVLAEIPAPAGGR